MSFHVNGINRPCQEEAASEIVFNSSEVLGHIMWFFPLTKTNEVGRVFPLVNKRFEKVSEAVSQQMLRHLERKYSFEVPAGFENGPKRQLIMKLIFDRDESLISYMRSLLASGPLRLSGDKIDLPFPELQEGKVHMHENAETVRKWILIHMDTIFEAIIDALRRRKINGEGGFLLPPEMVERALWFSEHPWDWDLSILSLAQMLLRELTVQGQFVHATINAAQNTYTHRDPTIRANAVDLISQAVLQGEGITEAHEILDAVRDDLNESVQMNVNQLMECLTHVPN